MKIEPVTTNQGESLQGILLITPTIFKDNRGYFYESFNQDEFLMALKANHQGSCSFVQDNQSSSCRGVLRGLHYQLNPSAQAKLVRCIAGEIFDVAVDIRRQSPTFGKWVGVYLSSENHKQLWIPAGFAHGFLTLSSNAEVIYKTTSYWNKSLERTINWADPSIAVTWPSIQNLRAPILSLKDESAPNLDDQSCVF